MTRATNRTNFAAWAGAAGAAIVVGGAALPWGRSGRVDRTAFELVRVARRLDVLEGAAAAAARWWALAPLVLAATVVAGGARRPALTLALATVLAGAAVLLVVAVHCSPLGPRPGLHVTAAGAAVVALADVAALVARRRPRPQ